MGIYGGMNDVSSDSIPIYLVVTAANWVSYLRALLFIFLESVGFLHWRHQECHESENLGLGLAKIMALAEELEKNPSFGYGSCGVDGGEEKECVVCLCRIEQGEEVRKLGCSHVFHRSCLDGWFGMLKMNCPLCRAPLMEEESFRSKEKQISLELLGWFS
ncbi:unnamed protein product [Victoria cruziana]